MYSDTVVVLTMSGNGFTILLTRFFLFLLQDVIEKGKPVLWSPSLHKKVVRVLNGNKVEDKVTQFLIAILECIANNILRVRMDVEWNKKHVVIIRFSQRGRNSEILRSLGRKQSNGMRTKLV